MTPLAHQLARYLTVPIKRRPEVWRGPELGLLLNDIHCFEVTDVLDLAGEICRTAVGRVGSVLGDRLFLPAPRTWLEAIVDGARYAYLLEKWDEESVCVIPVSADGIGETFHIELSAAWSERVPPMAEVIRGLLYIINSPKIFGRRQHMPHVGLEKKLRDAKPTIGSYPLHAWQEILLEARPTYFDDSGVEHEAHLTGRKCLHFCRAHLRVRNGRLETVSSHWRGDPALGIKRTRYKVAPPKDSKPRKHRDGEIAVR